MNRTIIVKHLWSLLKLRASLFAQLDSFLFLGRHGSTSLEANYYQNVPHKLYPSRQKNACKRLKLLTVYALQILNLRYTCFVYTFLIHNRKPRLASSNVQISHMFTDTIIFSSFSRPFLFVSYTIFSPRVNHSYINNFELFQKSHFLFFYKKNVKTFAGTKFLTFRTLYILMETSEIKTADSTSRVDWTKLKGGCAWHNSTLCMKN
jgi:hypothetical protein